MGSLEEHKALSKSKKLGSARDRLLANFVLKHDKALDAQRIHKKGQRYFLSVSVKLSYIDFTVRWNNTEDCPQLSSLYIVATAFPSVS